MGLRAGSLADVRDIGVDSVTQEDVEIRMSLMQPSHALVFT